MQKTVRIVIVGMGQRSMIYARESLLDPSLFKVVGVADVDPDRVRLARDDPRDCDHRVSKQRRE